MPNQKPTCRCGHTALAHELDGIKPQCSANLCTCLQYKPPIVAPVAAAAIAADWIETLLAEGMRRTPKIRRLAERIGAQIEQLRRLVEDDNEAAAAREKIAELEEKLRAAKAKIVRPKKTTRKPTGPKLAVETLFTCPDCDKSFTSSQGRGAHRNKAHGYRKAS